MPPVGPVDLISDWMTIHSLNNIAFSEVGVDTDGVKYAVLSEENTVLALDGETVAFTYTGPQAVTTDYDKICWIVSYEPLDYSSGQCGPDYVPAWQEYYAAPTVLFPGTTPTYAWVTPFSGQVFVGQQFGGGHWCPQRYNVIVSWVRTRGSNIAWGERFRIKGLRCTEEGNTSF